MQDDTQRTDAATPSTPGAQPPPTTPPPTSAPPATSPAAESGSGEARGFGSLGLAPDRTEALREAFRSESQREPLPFHTELDTSLQYGFEHHEPVYLPLALSVGAGFKFGCGFMLAVGVSLFGLFLAASVIFFVAALAGVPVPGAMP